jgi:hypothetical protein
MSARSNLLDLYGQWRTLSDEEAEAIRVAAWPQVARCQDAKQVLQTRILETTDQWHLESLIGHDDHPAMDPQVRRVVEELILLELRNTELVDEQRRNARREQQALDRSSRNLQQLQRAYAPSRESLWQSYS